MMTSAQRDRRLARIGKKLDTVNARHEDAVAELEAERAWLEDVTISDEPAETYPAATA